MVSKEDESYDHPLINTDKLEEIISVYKFPFILSLIGIVLLVLAAGLLVKNQITTSDVVFTTQASPSATVKIRIDIGGAVVSAGVYTLEDGSRIADALTFAGGLSADADREWVAKNLNRAAKLVDGGKIYIPSAAETASGKFEARNSKSENNLSNLGDLGDPSTTLPAGLLGVSVGKVNINSASSAELEALPGIGPVTAGKIIAGRPYQSVEELKSRKIIGQSLYNKLKDLLTAY